jgi:hypothetical protein
MERSSNQKDRGWIMAPLFTVLGVIYLMDGLRNPDTELYRLLMGAGFLLAAPQAFFHPIRLSRGKIRTSLETPSDWLAVIGVFLLIAGLVVRWL